MYISAFNSLVSIPQYPKLWWRLYNGTRDYARTGKTPNNAYQALIKLHCRTNGHSNDFLHEIVRRRHPQRQLPDASGVLGQLSQADIVELTATLTRDGFVVFPERLAADACDRLAEFAKSNEARLVSSTEENGKLAVFDAEAPRGSGYKFAEETVIKAPDAQKLMADKSVLAVVQSYLGCEPMMDIADMWWSVAAKKITAETQELAQLYHFDMNRIKWLKVMFYLTDVDTNNGPHCFIRGSHEAGCQPGDILDRGYARIPDEDLAPYYAKENFIELTGKRGTIIIADTRGFHKGKTPVDNDRLVFQLNFSDSMFGSDYDCPSLPERRDPELEHMMEMFPRTYWRFADNPRPLH